MDGHENSHICVSLISLGRQVGINYSLKVMGLWKGFYLFYLPHSVASTEHS